MSFSHPFPNNKRARDEVKSSGRPSQGDESLPAPNLPDRAEALEALDHGHRQMLAVWNEIAALASIPEPKPLDPALAALLGKDIAPMREQVLQDMVMLDANLDQSGAAELHLLAATVCATLDEMAAVLRREIGS